MVADAEKRKLNAREQSDPIIHLLTLSHDTWTSDLTYARDDADLTSNSVLFSKMPFKWRRPREGSGSPVGRLEVWNYQSTLGALVDAAPTPITVAMKTVFKSTPNTTIKEWPFMEWRECSWNVRWVAGSLVYPAYGAELWPPRVVTNLDFPGLKW